MSEESFSTHETVETVEPSILHSPSTHSVDTVARQLQRDILGGDFLVSLFWSAMNSFRHDSILRPFPPMFVESLSEEEEGHKDIESVRRVVDSLPHLEKISSGKVSPSTQQVELLHWILNPKKFTVCSNSPSSFDNLLEQVDPKSAKSSKKLSQKPKYIFELQYNEEAETKFESISKDHGVMYAFHGSSVENFYSIVHNGLLNIFNKVSAFGEGTYLSTELGVCLNWSPSGPLWPCSALPHAASCVAMCQVVKHPSVMSRCQVGGEPNLQQNVPEKYFIVNNDEFIRIKYVLVFGAQKQVVKTRSWAQKNKFVILLIFYLVFLLCIGATQSKFLRRLSRKYYNYLS